MNPGTAERMQLDFFVVVWYGYSGYMKDLRVGCFVYCVDSVFLIVPLFSNCCFCVIDYCRIVTLSMFKVFYMFSVAFLKVAINF